MNRKIIFRGRDYSDKWHFGNLLCRRDKSPVPETTQEYEEYHIQEQDFSGVETEVDVKTIGKYINLKDKNKKKIFEGDILYQEGRLLGIVCISARYGISIQKKTSTWSLRNFVCDSDFDTGKLSDIEVRGNIHDNPELLK